MMRARLLLCALLVLLTGPLLAGCGIDTKDAGNPDPAISRTTTTSTTGVDEQLTDKLPKRGDGIVAVQGPAQGSLTPQVSGTADVRVSYAPQGEDDGFRDLCEGRIDVLDTSRRISDAEAKLCKRNGVDLAQEIQVASDAIVIATPNEHDVGGDCLRISTVRDIFQAGSPINNWNQVGFFNVALRATGGSASSPAFQSFAQRALAVDGVATADDVRGDYILRSTDDQTRREVTSEARLDRVRARYDDRLKRTRRARRIEFRRFVNRAIARAKQRMLDRFDAENDEIAATQRVLTPLQKENIERRHLREILAAQRRAQERATARFQFPRLRFLLARYQAALRRARKLGTIGIFPFSYYELYEQRLRPMEIWDPERAAATLASMNGVHVAGAAGAATTTTTTATTGTGTTATGTTATATTETTATTPSVEQQQNGDVTVDAARTPWCVFPSQQTITNGSYPLSRPLLLYVSKLNLQRNEVQAFLRAYLNGATALARRNRLVPITEAVQSQNEAIIKLDDTPGTVAEGELDGVSTTTTTTTTEALPGVGQGSATQTTDTTPAATTTTSTTTTTAP